MTTKKNFWKLFSFVNYTFMAEINTYIEWLKRFKIEQKLSYKKMASVINYSDAGINKAIEKRTLSISQIKLIAEKLKGEESLKNFINANFDKKTNNVLKELIEHFNNIDEDELSLLMLKFKERIVNNEVLSLFIQQKAVKMAKDILIEDIKSKI